MGRVVWDSLCEPTKEELPHLPPSMYGSKIWDWAYGIGHEDRKLGYPHTQLNDERFQDAVQLERKDLYQRVCLISLYFHRNYLPDWTDEQLSNVWPSIVFCVTGGAGIGRGYSVWSHGLWWVTNHK